jgi:hypothetical protein
VAEWTSSHKAAISTADSDLVLVARVIEGVRAAFEQRSETARCLGIRRSLGKDLSAAASA